MDISQSLGVTLAAIAGVMSAIGPKQLRWLAVLLFCLTLTQPVNAQENLPGRWHFTEDGESKSCILVGEGFNSGLAIIAGPNKVMISVTLLRGRRPVDRDDGSGTLVAVTPNSLRRSIEEVTIPLIGLEPDTRGNKVAASYGAAVTRNEVQKVLGLITAASDDTDGSLLFRFGGLEERFLASASKNEVAAMQACMDKR
jgi:hypothetical protein